MPTSIIQSSEIFGKPALLADLYSLIVVALIFDWIAALPKPVFVVSNTIPISAQEIEQVVELNAAINVDVGWVGDDTAVQLPIPV